MGEGGGERRRKGAYFANNFLSTMKLSRLDEARSLVEPRCATRVGKKKGEKERNKKEERKPRVR